MLDKKAKFDRYREDVPDRTFEPGESFPYLGDDHELVVEPRQKFVVEDRTIRLRKSAVDQSSIKQALRNFYRRQAREYLSDRLDHFAAEMGLEIRKPADRWPKHRVRVLRGPDRAVAGPSGFRALTQERR